ncbi:MAG: group 1 truncated hemoglobin [Lysobacteraceae bacterium]|nr:MAG: group 1 truncated hemoglobin [Xanthomonadaceae bacterium]
MKAAIPFLLALALAGCALRSPAPPGDDALYRALGGQQGIAAIVEELLVRAVEDPRIGRHFAKTDLVQLHERLSEQICFEAGGPCSYRGRSMEEAHAGMQLDEADFNRLVEHLVDAMEARKVPTRAQNRLLRRLAPMRAQVIHR